MLLLQGFFSLLFFNNFIYIFIFWFISFQLSMVFLSERVCVWASFSVCCVFAYYIHSCCLLRFYCYYYYSFVLVYSHKWNPSYDIHICTMWWTFVSRNAHTQTYTHFYFFQLKRRKKHMKMFQHFHTNNIFTVHSIHTYADANQCILFDCSIHKLIYIWFVWFVLVDLSSLSLVSFDLFACIVFVFRLKKKIQCARMSWHIVCF